MWDKIETIYDGQIKFELELRGELIIIGGDSSSGKSFFCQAIETEITAAHIYKNDNIFKHCKLYRQGVKLTEEGIRSLSGWLIIIDNADILLRGERRLVSHINTDPDNQYIIMSRARLGFDVSPNYRADMKKCPDGVYRLEYHADIPGWH